MKLDTDSFRPGLAIERRPGHTIDKHTPKGQVEHGASLGPALNSLKSKRMG